MCDIVDDMMVIADKHNALTEGEMFRDILVDLVMEEERRVNPHDNFMKRWQK